MAEPSAPLVDVVIRLGRALLALAVVVAATGGLVAPYVMGRLSEDGDPVPLGLVQWSAIEFEETSVSYQLWRVDVAAVTWLALAIALLAAVRYLMIIPPKVVSVIGTVLTAAFLVCAVMVYPLSGLVADRAGEDWQFQWGWWVPILAGLLSALANWFDRQLRDAGWDHGSLTG